MSRVGKTQIKIPSAVTVTVEGRTINVRGPRGAMSYNIPSVVTVQREQDHLMFAPKNEDGSSTALWGTAQRIVANMVHGVDKGFEANLELAGVGNRASVQGGNLVLQLGFSHDVLYPIPEGVEIRCEKPTAIKITGADKHRVGQTAAEIRKYKKPEPYKGKGIILEGQYILRKEGKKK